MSRSLFRIVENSALNLTLPVLSIQFLRDLREFFGTSFKIKAATGDVPEYTLSCVGMGFQNVNKKA